MEKKVILITGASSGIGYDTTEMLAKQGHKVYGAARRVDSLKALADLGVEGIAMDVTDDASLEAGVKQIIVVAKAMSKAVNDRKPKTRYVVGFMSSTLIFMSKWLPARWFDALIMKMM